jgi:signal transduction histidine kinase
MIQPSIRRALLIRCGLGVGVLLLLLSLGVFLLAKQSLYREVDESISQTAALLGNQVELEDDRIGFEWKEGIGTNKKLIEEGFFQFWNEGTGTTTRSPGLRQTDLPRFTGESGNPRLKSIELPNGHRARAIGLRIYPFVLPEEVERMKRRGRVIDPKSLPHILVVARDTEPVHHTLARLRWILAGGSTLTLALGFFLIERVVRVSLRPIDDLTAQMKSRSGPELDSALDMPGKLPVELTGLAENFDALLARVSVARERERDFTRHAAHELRTPIAGLLATIELALSKPRGAESYSEYLETCRSSSAELGELVQRLTALARIGQSSPVPKLEPLDLAPILVELLEQFRPALLVRHLHFKPENPSTGWMVQGDHTLIRIILNNLLDNTISHASDGGEIRITGDFKQDHLEMRIANPVDSLPENLDRLFEPLFRSDPSRNDAGSHLGIGLTLSRDAASAMQSDLSARKTDEGWIEFVLRVPACRNVRT